MRSPVGGYELRQLAGSAADIGTQGQAWVRLGNTMATTAAALKDIGDSSLCTSQGTDKLAEMAAESEDDVRRSGVRYLKTGTALKTYSDALSTAQNWISTNQSLIEGAEQQYISAQSAHASAVSDQRSLETVWLWETEPTDTQLRQAQTAVDNASNALSGATTTRNEKWAEFDQVFEAWSDEYDAAVVSIEAAMDTAGNNDGFWEFVDSLLEVIAVVLIVLTVIALIIGAPFTGILALVIGVLTVLTIALTALKWSAGRATLSDVAWSLTALIPFGIGKILSKGAPVLSQVVSGGRSVVTSVIRGGLPAFRFLRPTTWGTPFRSMFAPLTARAGLPGPGVFVNPFRSIVMGKSSIAQVDTFLTTMRGSQWASNPAVQNFISQTAANMPGKLTQILNTGSWLTFTGVSVAGATGSLPQIPWLNEISVK